MVLFHGQPDIWSDASSEAHSTLDVGFGVKIVSMRTLSWCLSSLAVPFFVLSALLAFVRIRDSLDSEREPTVFRRVLEGAELMLNCAPMLCILFLAAQIQAVHVSGGRDDPPEWILSCMQVATAAYLAQTLLCVAVPAITGDVPVVDADVVVVRSRSAVVSTASHLLMLTLCVACSGICLGIMATQAAPDVPRSPSVSCTAGLAVQFFLVQLLLSCAAASSPGGRSGCGPKIIRVLRLAAHTVFFAPMLCVLFIGARLRAMEVDRELGMPQPWAQDAFYACSYALLLQTSMVVLVPLLPGGDSRRGEGLMGGDVEVVLAQHEHGACRLLFALLRFAPGLALFGSVAVVIASILTLRSPGGAATPALPATTRCLLALAVLFFAVYAGLWGAIAARDLAREVWGRGHGRFRRSVTALLYTPLRAASGVVQLCPMLAVLFLSLRLRSQQLAGNAGHPPRWAQGAMYLCTGSLVALTLVSLAVGVASPRKRPAGAEGSGFARAALGIHALASACLHGGAAAVCVALYIVTPESARV